MGDDMAARGHASPPAVTASPARDDDGAAAPAAGVLVGVALAAAAVVGALAVSGVAGPGGRVVGGDLPVNAPGASAVDVSAFNSPALQANPRDGADLVVADRVDTPVTTCAV